MKKSFLFIWLLILGLALVSCGGGSDASDAAAGEPIDGIWVDDDYNLVIDGTVGYYDTGSGFVYGCAVNLSKQTITIIGYSWNDKDPVYSYDFLKDKLILETDDKKALSDTLTFELSGKELKNSESMQLDGEWYINNDVLTIDGEKGLLETDYDPYKCEVDTKGKTITINNYSWDDSDPVYNYTLINGKLLLCSDSKEAFDKTMLLLTKDEYDALPNDESSDIELEEDEADFEDEDFGDSSDSVFSPKDVSDKTIESIKTYGDYLAMYKAIIDDYWANYESVIKGTILYDEASFQEMKDGLDEGFKEQEELYGSMKNKRLVGKSDLVQYLKDYRDGLKEYVDSIEESIDAA